MTLRLARVTLKQHRFEVVAFVLAALAVAGWAAWILMQLDGIGVSPDCIRAYARTDTGEVPPECQGAIRAYLDILVPQGQEVFRLMGLLPFGVGLLAAVPIVARELETGTAQTAWSLNASRVRWLRRQAWPIATIAVIAFAFTAVATTELARRDIAIGSSELTLLGLHGFPAVARFVAAFGLGLLAGSVISRSVPALVIGGILCAALYVGVTYARGAWIAGQEPSIRPLAFDGRVWVPTGRWAWLTPNGDPLSDEEVAVLVPDDVERRDAGRDLPQATFEWLELSGYRITSLGVPERQAVDGWYPYDIVLHIAAGAVGVVGAFAVVNRRRPI